MNKSEIKLLFILLIWELWTVNYSPKGIHFYEICVCMNNAQNPLASQNHAYVPLCLSLDLIYNLSFISQIYHVSDLSHLRSMRFLSYLIYDISDLWNFAQEPYHSIKLGNTPLLITDHSHLQDIFCRYLSNIFAKVVIQPSTSQSVWPLTQPLQLQLSIHNQI